MHLSSIHDSFDTSLRSMQMLIARPVSPNGTRYSREAGKFGGIQSRNADSWRLTLVDCDAANEAARLLAERRSSTKAAKASFFVAPSGTRSRYEGGTVT